MQQARNQIFNFKVNSSVPSVAVNSQGHVNAKILTARQFFSSNLLLQYGTSTD